MVLVYLLVVVLPGCALGVSTSGTLCLLLIMPVWHFDDVYGRCARLSVGAGALTRLRRVWRSRPAHLHVHHFDLLGVVAGFFITVLLGALFWATSH